MSSLSALLNPKSVAVIGASQNTNRAGHIVTKNLLESVFRGTVLPVTPKYSAVCGVLAYRSISDLPISPDLAVVCTHSSRNRQILTELAALGVGVAIILSSDLVTANTNDDQQDDIEYAKQLGIRILGPNSLGIILPWIGLNASFSPIPALPGKIAFISQSAAICTTVLDWAQEKNIGFSSFISIGHGSDIGFAELLDILCIDSKTEAILLYVDNITDARRFISAARAASRNRRILVLKGGRTSAGRKAAVAHNGGESSLDIVYDSAIRRSGMLRVHNNHELFAAVETLTHAVPLRGERLAIITNGGGPAVMATDTLLEHGGKLAQLDDATVEKLTAALPQGWSYNNPVDIGGDANEKRYTTSLNILLDSDDIDAILIMHSPSAVASSLETASQIIEVIKRHPKSKKFNILTNWSGESSAKQARLLFTENGIPTYRTPESAVTAFMHLVEYRRNQKHLMETPSTAEETNAEGVEKAQTHIQHCLEQNVMELDTHQTTAIFSGYGLDVLPTHVAHDGAEAAHLAQTLGYPVTVKLCSQDIVHKSDVHGIMLNLRDATEVVSAAHAILDRAKESFPSAQIQGLTVQPMAAISGAAELRVKVKSDPIFGPIILLGHGGANWNEEQDSAAAFPPLNMTLARYLIIRAIKGRKIHVQNLPSPISMEVLSQCLVRISQIVVDNPNIAEIDIHPLIISGDSVTIIDADITLQAYEGDAHQRLAIRPYPKELEELAELKNGHTVLLRPILPEDEPKHADFIHNVSKEDLYKRFFSDIGELNHEALANLTQIDYDREMAFVAVEKTAQGKEIIGVVRALINPDNTDGEFAVLIRSDLKGIGLGKILMNKIIEYCKAKGTKQLSGMTMPSNTGMLKLAQNVGFKIDIQFEDGIAEMCLPLNP